MAGARTIAALILGVVACATDARAADAGPSAAAVESLKQYLRQEPAKRGALELQSFATARLTKADADAAKDLLWQDHLATVRTARAEEIRERVIKDGTLRMPVYYRIYGDKPPPPGGRSLYLSLHGGGNMTDAYNDQQWENQKRLYRPAEGIYLVPRAPTNTASLWFEPQIDRMLDRLIEDLIVLEEVDPNRVYLLGYSAGGNGVYHLAPRMADRFAAASTMAGSPGDARPEGLRNLPFSIHVGAMDGDYHRNQAAQEWGTKLDGLQLGDPGGYAHWVKLYEGKGHLLEGQEAEAIPWMAKNVRDPIPTQVVWIQDKVTHSRFYWLAIEPAMEKYPSVVKASYVKQGQRVMVETKDFPRVIVRLNDDMVDLDKPVVVFSGEKQQYSGVVPRTIATLSRTLRERGDPASVFSGQIEVRMER